jgi:isoquinoline 1-oxidoreductase beta subunit
MEGYGAWGFAALPYGIPNQRAEITSVVSPYTQGTWRAPGHVNAAFVIESFIDELAHAGRHDPYKFRRQLLEANPGTDPGFRHKHAWIQALDIVADKSGWGSPLPRGRGRGIAIDDRRKHTHPAAGDYMLVTVAATVAEVTVTREGRVQVDRVVVAHDKGVENGFINPKAVEQQIRGQFAWAIGPGVMHEITFDRGRVTESNFHNYPMVRMAEAPPIIEIYEFTKGEWIAGAGEEVVASIMPAICNAIFAAIGTRVRRLPIYKYANLRWT